MSTTVSSIPHPILHEHIARLHDLMREDDLAAVLLFHTSSMLAYTGTPHSSSDRITCGAVTRDGQVIAICPAFERPNVSGADGIATIDTWEEHEDPYRCFADAITKAGVTSGTVGVDGRIWLEYLHGFERALPALKFRSAEHLLREVRLCKSPAELDAMRAAHRKGEQVFLALRDEMLRPGIQERELARELYTRFLPQGIFINPLIQAGPNGSVPHNPPGERPLQADDGTIVVDSVISWQGYTNDLTRTFSLGPPSDKMKRAYHAVREAQATAIDATKPGVPCRKLDGIARDIITKAGFGEFFSHRLGHGIGIECHEPPYLDGGNDELLRPGMCFTFEPGVYVPGEFGIRIEDDVTVTDNGHEVIRGELPTDVTDAFDR